jgi:hypothetical protein
MQQQTCLLARDSAVCLGDVPIGGTQLSQQRQTSAAGEIRRSNRNHVTGSRSGLEPRPTGRAVLRSVGRSVDANPSAARFGGGSGSSPAIIMASLTCGAASRACSLDFQLAHDDRVPLF